MRFFLRLAAAALVALVIAAIVVQYATDAVPMGLFNTGRGVARGVSAVALVLAVAAFAVLVLELVRRRSWRIADAIRGVVAALVVLELLVTLTDLAFMSRSPTAPLGGPYYETRGESGRWLILRKHAGGSPFGFRTATPYAKETADYRVLFLGDSFTEGSGRRAECNYPTVVERELALRMGQAVQVMNAGVSGYGPSQSVALFRELRARGYRVDAVVYNFLIENDFTDDLPGTERRVVAGMAFRFPRSWFLRTFQPVNSRTFRTAMFLRALIRIRYELHDFSAISDEPCDLEPERLTELPQTIRDIVTRKLADLDRVATSARLQEEAAAALRALRGESDAAGVPLVVVVFPDRASVDPDVRRLLGLGDEDLLATRRLRTVVDVALPDTPVLDAGEVLGTRAGLYRRVDTHLDDLGNVVVGRWVADQIAPILEGR